MSHRKPPARGRLFSKNGKYLNSNHTWFMVPYKGVEAELKFCPKLQIPFALKHERTYEMRAQVCYPESGNLEVECASSDFDIPLPKKFVIWRTVTEDHILPNFDEQDQAAFFGLKPQNGFKQLGKRYDIPVRLVVKCTAKFKKGQLKSWIATTFHSLAVERSEGMLLMNEAATELRLAEIAMNQAKVAFRSCKV